MLELRVPSFPVAHGCILDLAAESSLCVLDVPGGQGMARPILAPTSRVFDGNVVQNLLVRFAVVCHTRSRQRAAPP
jgi:hypothetical protein